MTNEADGDWPVARIQTSCGCTVAKVFGPDGLECPTRSRNNEPIVVVPPGKAMTVKVDFNTSGKHGDVSQKIQVHNVDPEITAVEVPVHVRVNRALQVNPAWLNLGNISKSDDVEQMVTIEALEIGDWDIAGFESQIEGQELPDWLNFEVMDGEGGNRRIKVSLGGNRPVGALSPRVRVKIDHDRIDHVDFTITGVVQPNVSFSSGHPTFRENISFDKVAPDEKVTRTLTITNKDEAVPYKLEAVDLLTPQKEFFSTEFRAVEDGATYEVDVTVDGAIDAPFFRGSLVLRADHPDVPTKTIPFHGWVKK